MKGDGITTYIYIYIHIYICKTSSQKWREQVQKHISLEGSDLILFSIFPQANIQHCLPLESSEELFLAECLLPN